MKTLVKSLPFILLLLCCGVYIQTAVSNTQYKSINPHTAPLPKAILCKHSMTSNPEMNYRLTMEQLMALDSLCLDAVVSHSKSRVLRYNITLVPKLEPASQIQITGNNFGVTVKQLFSKLHAGDLIFIDQIKIYDGNSRQEITAGPISIGLF